jgi:hypothetical protein
MTVDGAARSALWSAACWTVGWISNVRSAAGALTLRRRPDRNIVVISDEELDRISSKRVSQSRVPRLFRIEQSPVQLEVRIVTI